MAISDLVVTEDYASLTIHTQDQLNDAMTSIEEHINTQIKLNMEQLALDIFDDTYEFNGDGIATRTNPLVTDYAAIDDDEIITGAWTFDNTVAFSETVTLQNVVNMTGQYRCKAYRDSTNLSIPDSTITVVGMNSESYDVTDMHDNTTNNERITIPSDGAGVYVISAQVNFAASATGVRNVYIYKDGTQIAKSVDNGPVAGSNSIINLSIHDYAAGDSYYDVRVYQSSGGALDVIYGAGETSFSVMKVS